MSKSHISLAVLGSPYISTPYLGLLASLPSLLLLLLIPVALLQEIDYFMHDLESKEHFYKVNA